MDAFQQKIHEAARFLKDRCREKPTIGILTGTGLEQAAAAVQAAFKVSYREIPHFPLPTVESHPGELLIGRLAGEPAVAMQGRLHLYEGHAPRQVALPVRIMQVLGVRTLMVTNAAGGLNPGFAAGDMMAIRDHINLTHANPLTGLQDEYWGPRFPDMTAAYPQELITLAKKAAAEEKLHLREGVYAGLAGPSLETPAETRFLKTIGADAVGFSTVPEVIAAVQAGMRVLGLSVITNINNPDRPRPALAEEIIAVARQNAPKLAAIIRRVAGGLRKSAGS